MARSPWVALVLGALLALPLPAQQAFWNQQTPSNPPPLRSRCGFTHDSLLALQVLFGGIDSGGAFRNETYFYDGIGTWALLTPMTQPSARVCSMVYDSARAVHVVYGGDDGSFPGLPTDTWEFDGSDWAQVATMSNPGARVDTAMSYDPVQSKTVLFSGAGLITIYASDTWTYDGTNWTMVSTGGAPGGRRGHRMIYDSVRGKHVLFGGESHLLFKYNDTWEFDAATNLWTQVTTPNAPPVRSLHAMAYDATRGVTIIHGGSDANGAALGDTWEYDGVNWTQVAVGTSPSPRQGARFASDAANGSAILYGGSPSSISTNDTWRYAVAQPVYPGNGGDCRIDLEVNGLAAFPAGGVQGLLPTDGFALDLVSPGGGLHGQTLALVYTFYPMGNPPAGLALLGSGPADVWVDPSNAVVVLDSLGAPSSIFVPLLLPGGLFMGPYNVPAGLTGFAANLQLFVNDPGANPVNLSVSNAVVLEFN